jgi:hypothetical protein
VRPVRRRRGPRGHGQAVGPDGVPGEHRVEGGVAERLDRTGDQGQPARVVGGQREHRPVAAEQHPARPEHVEHVGQVRQHLPGRPGVPVGLGHEPGRLAHHAGQRGQVGEVGPPRGAGAARAGHVVGDRRLARVVEHDAQPGLAVEHVAQRGHHLGQLRRAHAQVGGEPGPGDLDEAVAVGRGAEDAVGLVLGGPPDPPHERTLGERRELVGHGRAPLDARVRHDAEHRHGRVQGGDEVDLGERLVRAAVRLHVHDARDPEARRVRRQVLRQVRPAQARELVQPRVGQALGVPVVHVGVDDGPHVRPPRPRASARPSRR